MAITRRGRKTRRTKKHVKKHTKRARKSRRHMRGGDNRRRNYENYAYLARMRRQNEEMNRGDHGKRQVSDDDIKNANDVVDLLFKVNLITEDEKQSAIVGDNEFIFGEQGIIRTIRDQFNKYKKETEKKKKSLPYYLLARVAMQEDLFLRGGTYADLYSDLKALYKPELAAIAAAQAANAEFEEEKNKLNAAQNTTSDEISIEAEEPAADEINEEEDAAAGYMNVN
jgi:hypothetical protein